jgi:hypothetical protein
MQAAAQVGPQAVRECHRRPVVHGVLLYGCVRCVRGGWMVCMMCYGGPRGLAGAQLFAEAGVVMLLVCGCGM